MTDISIQHKQIVPSSRITHLFKLLTSSLFAFKSIPLQTPIQMLHNPLFPSCIAFGLSLKFHLAQSKYSSLWLLISGSRDHFFWWQIILTFTPSLVLYLAQADCFSLQMFALLILSPFFIQYKILASSLLLNLS